MSSRVPVTYLLNQDSDQFVEQAHQVGIAVISDVVYNLLGPSVLVLWQFGGWSENGRGRIYFYNDGRVAGTA